MTATLQVLDPGILTLVVDRGRPGLAANGVGPSGPADRAAFALGARLLAQDTDSAGLECLLGRLAVRTTRPIQVALTGALTPADVDGVPVGFGEVLSLPAGAVLRLGAPATGLRTYVSIGGGLAVRPVLGSRCTDTLSGIGPEPLRAGDELLVGATDLSAARRRADSTTPTGDTGPERGVRASDVETPDPGDAGSPGSAPGVRAVTPRPSAATWSTTRVWVPPTPAGAIVLDALPGPRLDWLADPRALVATAWTVSPRSDRVGLRLAGAPLRRAADRAGTELPSEGLVRGAVQVPPGGEPIIFGADHPVTGGYPVVAVLTERSSDTAAQLRPGQPVSLNLVAPYTH